MFLSLFIILAGVFILMSLPGLVPRCSCCGRLKARPWIRIHKAVGLNPGYGGYRSVCVKCCRKYEIHNIPDLNRVNEIRRRIRLETLKRDAGH